MSLHPDTLTVLRKDRPGLADIPDDALAKTTTAAWVSMGLYLRDLQREVIASAARVGAEIRKWVTRQ